MPSPIAHTTMGYVIYRVYQARGPGRSLGQFGRLPGLLILTAGLSLLPDADSIAGLLLGDFGRYHNGLSHSLFVGLVVALLIGGLAWWVKRSGFVEWFAIALLCYQFHIILDFSTVGRGVMLFWPLTLARFQSSVKLFHGLHWSDGLVSLNHVWTLLNELGFAVLVALVIHFQGRHTRRSDQGDAFRKRESMEKAPNTGGPIRVVVFGGGPVLERGVRQFMCQLEAHSEIALVGAFCQSEAQTFWAVARDLWRRRRLLALPLLLVQVAGSIGRYLSQPRAESELNRTIARLSDRIHYVPDIHAEEVLEEVRALQPDLGLIYGSPILKPELFEIPTQCTLGIHHGKVPEYRGKKTTFWAMYNGEETAGVTIQKVNAGLDTGQIVKEGAVQIGHRSQRAVWNELEALGFALYTQAVLEVKAGTATYRPQVGNRGKLHRDPKLGHILTLWRRQLIRRSH